MLNLRPACAGRVLALLRDVDVDLSLSSTDGGVTGMAYEVEEEDWPAVLEALDIRERHGYTRRMGVGVPLFHQERIVLIGWKVFFFCFDMEDCWGH